MSQAIIITLIICGTVLGLVFMILVSALIMSGRKVREEKEKLAGFERNFKPEQTAEIINKSLNDILDEYEKKE